MAKLKRNKIKSFIVFMLMMSLSLNVVNNLGLYHNYYLDKIIFKNLNISIISPKVHIIGNGGWASFRADGNCTGSGLSTDPYIIRDLEINAGGSGSGIIIENSDVYFKIKNVTIWNSGSSLGDAGISLKSVMNGLIENNTLLDSWHAIMLDNSDNNLILNNTIKDGFYIGILFYANSQYNNVSKNLIKDGARAVQSYFTNSNNTIYNNTMISNTYGIYIAGENYTVTDNIIKENHYGIRLDDESFIVITKSGALNPYT